MPPTFAPTKTLLRAACALAAIALLPAATASATTFNYVLNGIASGDLDGVTFGSSSFTISLTEPTSAITNLGGGYYAYEGVNASVSAGSFSGTLEDVVLETNGNTGFQNIDLYDSAFTNGVGLDESAALLGYALATAVSTGTVTGADLSPTLGSSSFPTTGGDTVQFTGLTQLSFTASAVTPEPSTLLLLATGLSGLALLRRRFCA